jgi:methanethiol S-methyltransferase
MLFNLKEHMERKSVFVTIGLFNVVFFHYSIMRLWFFLLNSSNRLILDTPYWGWAINTVLIVFFSVPHSLLLNSNVKKSLLNFIPNKLYSTTYSIHACIAITLMDTFWVDSGISIFHLPRNLESIIFVLYTLSWLFMFWSMIATGLFRQSGIEEWWKALRNENTKNPLPKNGPYKICRHPIYASFLGMIWFTPYMSIERLYLSLAWTIYILIGASLKERRLRKNKDYQVYSQNVPAFPFIPKGWDNFLTSKIWRQQ